MKKVFILACFSVVCLLCIGCSENEKIYEVYSGYPDTTRGVVLVMGFTEANMDSVDWDFIDYDCSIRFNPASLPISYCKVFVHLSELERRGVKYNLKVYKND
jgi:hypothetical protein